ncbi:MAG: NAD(P)/FAD-dependent oxidoreductase [Anaerolineae bacterium]
MYDVIIVGAGPAGLTAGIYARDRRLKTLILEAGEPGGQLVTLYPDKPIYDYPSYPQIVARDLAQKMVEHVIAEGCELRTRETVEDVISQDDRILVRTNKGTYETRTVIVAAGMGLFEPRKLGVPGEAELEGQGVYYTVPSKELFRGQRVLFVGGGDTALEMALSVCDLAQVTLIHRRNVFRALESNVEAVGKSSIQVRFNTELKEIMGREQVERVILVNNQTGEEWGLEVDAVVINIGFKANLDLVKSWGLELEKNAIVVDSEMRTTKPGIFACGDVVVPAGQYKRIIIAGGQAAIAVNAAYKYIKQPYWA